MQFECSAGRFREPALRRAEQCGENAFQLSSQAQWHNKWSLAAAGDQEEIADGAPAASKDSGCRTLYVSLTAPCGLGAEGVQIHSANAFRTESRCSLSVANDFLLLASCNQEVSRAWNAKHDSLGMDESRPCGCALLLLHFQVDRRNPEAHFDAINWDLQLCCELLGGCAPLETPVKFQGEWLLHGVTLLCRLWKQLACHSRELGYHHFAES